MSPPPRFSLLAHAFGRRVFPLAGLLCALTSAPLFAAPDDLACTGAAPADATQQPIRMVFGGDIVLGNSFLVDNIPASWDRSYFGGVRPLLKDADLVFGNLEGVLTERNDTLKHPASGRQFAFKFPPRYAGLLRKEGFNIVNVANNHAFDFREEGFLDTLHNLDQAGILATGPRDRIETLTIRDFKIAIIGFTYSPRFNSVFELEHGAELVRQAKAQGAYVIATFHAGAEGPAAIWHGNEDEPFLGENRGNTVAFARAMIDAGADLAVGHGPHVLREAECYHGRPIVYSLGNFVGVGGLSAKKVAAVSALLEVLVNPDGTLRHLDLVPIRFDDRRVPQRDPRAFGVRLVNYLGQHAQYDGQFIEFPVSGSGEKAFLAWLKKNADDAPARHEPAALTQAAPSQSEALDNQQQAEHHR